MILDSLGEISIKELLAFHSDLSPIILVGTSLLRLMGVPGDYYTLQPCNTDRDDIREGGEMVLEKLFFE